MPSSVLKRIVVGGCLSALLALILPAAASAAYSVQSFGSTVQPTGPEVTVFDYDSNRCATNDIPDTAARAFRDDSGQVNLIATHYDARRMTGTTLDNVTHKCPVIFDSPDGQVYSSFANQEWLTSPYALAGNQVYALIHNEYQGYRYDPDCVDITKPDRPRLAIPKCWWNSVTEARSTNGGATYSHATPPNQLVAALPFKYETRTGPAGYFEPSNIVHNQNDGYYYATIHAEAHSKSAPPLEEAGTQEVGTCVMRTPSLTNPSWRAYHKDTGFTVQFVNPYTYQFTSTDTAAQHVCSPVSFQQIEKMSSSLTYNTYFDKFMLVGATSGLANGRIAPGIWYSLSDDLVHWEDRKLIAEAELPWTYQCSGGTTDCGTSPPGCTNPDPDPVLFPSILDPSSTSKNFETSDQHVYLYLTRFHYQDCGAGFNRDLKRIPIRFQRSRTATMEDGAFVHPTTGYDDARGQLQIKGTDSWPTPYEGSKFLRGVYFSSTGPAEGRFEETLPNGSDVWYGSAFYLHDQFSGAHTDVRLLQWFDPAGTVHGGVSLRSDHKYHAVRGNTANVADDTNIGPAFSLPENRWIWLEVHQRLDQASPLTEVFLDGNLISTSVAQNNYPDSAGVPTQISVGARSNAFNVVDLYFDRASVDVQQRGAVGAPPTPTGLNGNAGDTIVTVWWNASPGATKYRLYMDRDPVTHQKDGTWHWIREVSTTALFQTRLTNCIPYGFRVSAVNSAGLESVVSQPITLTPKPTNQPCP